MSYTIHACEQRTPAWYAARLGRLTASDVREALAIGKSGEAVGRKKIRANIVAERLTGLPCEDDWMSASMRRGLAFEAEARAAYEAHTGLLVETCGFVAHDGMLIGCSPDGVFADLVGGVELKCPEKHTHIEYLRGKSAVPSEYRKQVLHSLLVTGAQWWDFASYCPEMPERLRLFYVRVTRDAVDIAAHQVEVEKFLREVDAEEAALRTMADLPTALRQSVEAMA